MFVAFFGTDTGTDTDTGTIVLPGTSTGTTLAFTQTRGLDR